MENCALKHKSKTKTEVKGRKESNWGLCTGKKYHSYLLGFRKKIVIPNANIARVFIPGKQNIFCIVITKKNLDKKKKRKSGV